VTTDPRLDVMREDLKDLGRELRHVLERVEITLQELASAEGVL